MVLLLLMSLFVTCSTVKEISAMEGESSSLLEQSQRAMIARCKKQEGCAWLAAVGLGITTFATGVTLTTPFAENIMPENAAAAKLAWSLFGVSGACLVYNWYKFFTLRRENVVNAVKAHSNYYIRGLGTLTTVGMSLGSAIGLAGNQQVMANILMGFGLFSLGCDSVIPYVYYCDLDSELSAISTSIN